MNSNTITSQPHPLEALYTTPHYDDVVVQKIMPYYTELNHLKEIHSHAYISAATEHGYVFDFKECRRDFSRSKIKSLDPGCLILTDDGSIY